MKGKRNPPPFFSSPQTIQHCYKFPLADKDYSVYICGNVTLLAIMLYNVVNDLSIIQMV